MATRKEVTGINKSAKHLREKASDNVFVKDYLVHLDDSSKVSDEVKDVNKADVVASALQRGLRATAEAEVESVETVDEHNVHITYTLAVEPNTK